MRGAIEHAEEIQDTIVQSASKTSSDRRSQNELEEVIAKMFHLSLEEVMKGSIILRLTALSDGTASKFLNDVEHGRLAEFIKILFASCDVARLLPEEPIHLVVKLEIKEENPCTYERSKCGQILFSS